MEEDEKPITSPFLETSPIQRQMKHLEEVAAEGKKRVDYAVAHDPQVQKAIETVERFLRKSKRVCYGGQAINSLLPKKHQFYDERYNVPDYDFFSPEVDKDVKAITDELESQGFTDVKKKVGIHDGTYKIYVNFIPVADCTEMEPRLFDILRKRAVSVGGILYADPDFLRMLMYLELSRPRGQLDRWRKVYERLSLLNREFPVGECDHSIELHGGPGTDIRAKCLRFCMEHKRVVVGAEVVSVLKEGTGRVRMGSLMSVNAPVMFMSPQARLDAEDLMDILDLGSSATLEKETPTLTDLYECFMIRKGKTLIAMILQENACHSYTLVNKEEMRIGTPDLLLHIYYSIHIFGQKTRAFFPTEMSCLIQKIHSINDRSRESPSAFLPAFGLRCSGRQQGFASLLKEREARREASGKRKGKKDAKKLMRGGRIRKTRRKAKGKRQTRRR
jgi:hypothetical protein